MTDGDGNFDAETDPGEADEERPRPDATESEVDAWERTIDEMERLAAERETEGWETVTITAADTAPTPPEVGDDRYGLIYTVGDDVADDFRAVHEAGFDRYEVYRRELGDRLFLVTELLSGPSRTAVFVAGTVDRTLAEDLIAAAAARDEMYTHLQTLDWTRLGSVRHEDPADFFPSLS